MPDGSSNTSDQQTKPQPQVESNSNPQPIPTAPPLPSSLNPQKTTDEKIDTPDKQQALNRKNEQADKDRLGDQPKKSNHMPDSTGAGELMLAFRELRHRKEEKKAKEKMDEIKKKYHTNDAQQDAAYDKIEKILEQNRGNTTKSAREIAEQGLARDLKSLVSRMPAYDNSSAADLMRKLDKKVDKVINSDINIQHLNYPQQTPTPAVTPALETPFTQVPEAPGIVNNVQRPLTRTEALLDDLSLFEKDREEINQDISRKDNSVNFPLVAQIIKNAGGDKAEAAKILFSSGLGLDFAASVQGAYRTKNEEGVVEYDDSSHAKSMLQIADNIGTLYLTAEKEFKENTALPLEKYEYTHKTPKAANLKENVMLYCNRGGDYNSFDSATLNKIIDRHDGNLDRVARSLVEVGLGDKFLKFENDTSSSGLGPAAELMRCVEKEMKANPQFEQLGKNPEKSSTEHQSQRNESQRTMAP